MNGASQMSPPVIRQNHRQSTRRCGAFTLVELLVVIGIIAVLIAILFPVLRKAREQGRAAVCASDMRQLGIAALTYAAENKGVLPIPMGIQPPHPPVPFDAIAVDGLGILNWERGVLWPYIARDVQIRQRIFSCPSDDSDPRLIQGQTADFMLKLLPGTSRNFSYGYNYELTSPFGQSRFLHWGVRLTQVRHASSKLLVLEDEGPSGPSADVSDANGPPGPDGVLVHLTRRHNGMCNVCCFDGHVERLDPRIFENPTVNGRTFIATPTYEHYVDIFSDQ